MDSDRLKNHKVNCPCCICKAIRGENKGVNNPFYNKKHSIITRKIMSINHSNVKGENNPFYGKRHRDKTKLENRLFHLGREVSLNTKNKQSIGVKKALIEGRGFKNHTEETKKLLSLRGGGTGIPYEHTEYGSEFDSALKERVRFRDNYKCQLCGCSQVENGKCLDVHHKDYNKKNNDINNLVALCISCHRKTNFNRKYWLNKFKEIIWNMIALKIL